MRLKELSDILNERRIYKEAKSPSDGFFGTMWNDISKGYRNISPSAKRAALAGLMTGLGTFALSNGDFSDRAIKGLALGTAGGLGVYGVDKSGLIDSGVKYLKDTMRG